MRKSKGRQTRVRLSNNRKRRSSKRRSSKRRSSKRRSSKRRSSKRRKSHTGGYKAPDLPKGIRFQKGPYPKKYQAILPDGKKVNFGDQRYEHFKDRVPKRLGGKLWSHLDHKDPDRHDILLGLKSGVSCSL
jgi:hypothetical protein